MLAHSQKEKAGVRVVPPHPIRDQWLLTLDRVQEAVLFLDGAGEVTFCNSPAGALFGIDAETPGKREWPHLLQGLTAEWLSADPRPLAMETGQAQCVQVPLAGKWYAIRVSPVLAPGGRPDGAICVISDVTQTHEAQDELRRREGAFRALVENSPDWISRLDRDYRIQYANPALERAYGLPPESLVGRSVRNVPIPDDVQSTWDLLSPTVFEAGEELKMEHSLDVRGQRLYLHTRVVPEFGGNGQVETALTVTRDITEGRTIREELARLRDTNRRQRDSLVRHTARERALGAVVMEINAERSLEEVLLTTLSRVTQLLNGEDGSLFLLEDDGQHLRGAVEMEQHGWAGMIVNIEDWPQAKRAAQRGRPFYFTLPETEGLVREWIVCRGIWGSLVTPLVVNDRCIGLVFVNFRREGYTPPPDDISFAELITGQCALAIDRAQAHEERERLLVSERQARAEAERQASQMAALFQGVAEGVAILDREGRLILHNEAAAALLGLPLGPKPAMGRALPRVRIRALDGTLMPREEWPTHRAVRGEAVVDDELLVDRTDGSQIRVACSAGVVRDEGGEIARVVVTFRDVTELRRLERAKDDFLQVLAHELRNPLAAATGLVQLVTQRLDAEGNLRHTEHLSLAESELKRLNDLINEIIVGYRVSEGRLPLELRPLNLVDVLTGAIRPYALRLLDHKLIVSPPPVPRLPVIGDAKRLTEILANLLSNAIKYSPVGRWIWVSTSIENRSVVVRVEDEGIGIPPDQLERVFEGFYRATNLTNRQPGGLGLGLFISRDVARRHGGDLWAENRPGGGTTMGLRLPLTPGSRR